MPGRWTTPLSFVVVSAGFVFAYGEVVVRLVRQWSTDDNYSHALVVLPVAAYLIWQRRDRLAAARPEPSAAGALILGCSLALLAAGSLGAELFLARLSVVGAITGTVLFVAGRQHLRLLAFPLFLLLLCLPLPSIVFNQVTFPLQVLASRIGEAALWGAGVPVLREGNVITLAHARLEVAEACSGIRSLVSLLALAVVYGHFGDGRPWVRVVLAVVAVPVAIAVNGVRIAGTGLLAQAVGARAAEGFFHTFSGWLMFLAAFVLLVAVHRIVSLAAAVRWRPVAAAVQGTES